MAWAMLGAAGLFELIGVNGFQRLSVGHYRLGAPLTITGFALALSCLHVAAQSIPLTVAYAVFTATGTVGSVVMGVLFFGESIRLTRVFWIAVVIGSIVGLRLVGE